MGVDLKLRGSVELAQALRSLGEDVRRRAMRPAVLAASRVVRKRAKEIAESKGLKQTGALIRNIAHKVDINDETKVYVNIGVRHGRRFADMQRKRGRSVVDDPYYWHFHEFGTSKMAARPFLRPALEESKQAALDAMAKSLRARLKREARARGLRHDD